MVKVKLLKDHEHGGYVRHMGEVLSLSPERANKLIESGAAVKHVSDDDFASAPAPSAATKK